MWEMEAKTESVGPRFLVLYWRVGGIHVVKGWLKRLLK
jgi:hypothetical protein